MYKNGWQRIYFNDKNSLFSDRNGFTVPADVPNPFLGSQTLLREASEVDIIHPITKEPQRYRLTEYPFGDYVLKYATADLDVDGEVFTCVWRRTELLPRMNEANHLTPKAEAGQFPHSYGVYHSVPGMKAFIERYENVSFDKMWAEYDAYLNEKFGRLCVPLLPGNEKKQVLAAFEAYGSEPIEDFITLYTFCDGNDNSAWLDQIEEEGYAYAHIGGNPLMNLSEILHEVQHAGRSVTSHYPIESVPAGYVKNNEMLSSKIPIHHDGGGNFIAIDLDPDAEGQYGQIVEVDHEYSERVVLASSLKEYVAILYYFVKELGVIDNGEGFEGENPLSFYIRRK